MKVLSSMRRPSPRQSAHGLGIISPVPLQREQATLVTTCPSRDWRTRRSSPLPWQSMQVTGSVPGSRPPALTRRAGGGQPDGDLLAAAEHGLGELELETHLGVRAHLGAAPAGAGPAHLAEERLEDVAQAALEAEAAAAAGLGAEDALGAEAVVAGPPLGVAQDLVGDGDLLEARLGLGVTVVGVGVQLAGAGAVGPLDLVVAGVGADPEQRVEVAQPVSDGHRAPR